MTEEERTIRVGDHVRVLQPAMILATLDRHGTLEGLPFMPEMIPYCGRRFRVSYRVEKTCVACTLGDGRAETQLRGFADGDVLFLERLRCSGSAHDGCGRACMLFWKASWLEGASADVEDCPVEAAEADELRCHLKTISSNGAYFCQSTGLAKATGQLSILDRVVRLCREAWVDHLSCRAVVGSILLPIWRRLTLNRRLTGSRRTTPQEALSLAAGDEVEVKPFAEILKTLDARGANKGLQFVGDMRRMCGTRLRVRSRLDRMILEDSGRIVETKNTVILDGATCSYSRRFAGCPRLEFHYWREIWLKRVEG